MHSRSPAVSSSGRRDDGPTVSRLLFSVHRRGAWPPELIQLSPVLLLQHPPAGAEQNHAFRGPIDCRSHSPSSRVTIEWYASGFRLRCAGICGQPAALTLRAPLWHNSLTGFRGRRRPASGRHEERAVFDPRHPAGWAHRQGQRRDYVPRWPDPRRRRLSVLHRQLHREGRHLQGRGAGAAPHHSSPTTPIRCSAAPPRSASASPAPSPTPAAP